MMQVQDAYDNIHKRCSVRQITEAMTAETLEKIGGLTYEYVVYIFLLIVHHHTVTKGPVDPDKQGIAKTAMYGMKQSEGNVSFNFSKLPVVLRRILYTYLFHLD